MNQAAIAGAKFGKWKLLKELKHDAFNHDTRFECICECGKTNIVRRYSLISNRSKACRSCSKIKHGFTGSPTYIVWESMIKRCANPNSTAFKYYGGRGITVCERWKKFDNFVSDMGVRPLGLELDRVDTDGNYIKENCRWITHQENMNNRRCSK